MNADPGPAPEADAERDGPLVTFFRFIEQARPPQRADHAAAGTLPTRAFRYCEPARTASGFGWYLFPPMDFSLVWDGADVFWSFAGSGGWLPLKAVQFPDFVARFDEVAPDHIKGYTPPFLAALPEPGLVQIWTGIVARTAPGWSLLFRWLPNIARPGGWEPYEGIVETDHWFGPVISNLRLTRTHVPVEFKADFPMLLAQPVPHYVYEERLLNDYRVVARLDQLTEDDWAAYEHTVVRPNTMANRKRGAYAAEARKRKKAAGLHAATPDDDKPDV